ncbi:MAG: molybdopterin-guanine dinucleotide biosynthesis protein B [Acidimicrobiia bacterium]|jgi:molybdopterin-guanine dinucleotide biosynthesis protein B|nr:MAG: molybdopterin-guanine dinucleotide biosynthesis protein B [Acidimicrobiia bacterium]
MPVIGPPVVAIVGRSGSGKTTLLSRVIPSLRSRGLKVGVVKHHGHATSFDTPGKDTHRMSEAGAEVVVGVSSEQVAVFTPRREIDWLAQAAPFVGHANLVLAEGFSQSQLPKIEVHRSGRSDSLLSAPEDLLAIVSDVDWDLDLPTFTPDQIEQVADFLVELLGSQLEAHELAEPDVPPDA